MSKHKTYLIGIALFTLLFMVLMLAGSWLLSIESRRYAITCFFFAFGAVFGQIACLALYACEATRNKARLAAAQGNKNV